MARVRIALVHSFYSSRWPSGENVVVESQAQALRDAGHEVLLLGRHTDDLQVQPGYGARAATRVMTGRGGDPTRYLQAFAPDVVHVHNLFPNIGTQWLEQWPGPVVATVHNFRSMCANGLLFRDGQVCTECPDGDPWAALRHSCYRGSRLATLPLAVKNSRGIVGDAVLSRADRIVVLLAGVASILERYGLDLTRTRVIPHFVSDVTPAVAPTPTTQAWVVVGRLTPEKGVASLVSEWPPGVRLDVVGEGSEATKLTADGVQLLGNMDRDELRRRLPSYTGLILPSVSLESALPQTAMEALEAGVPIVARSGSLAAMDLKDTGAAVLWDDHGPIAPMLDRVRHGGASMRARARAVYETNYMPAAWIESLISCYHEVITS